jgi:hypothetical protein
MPKPCDTAGVTDATTILHRTDSAWFAVPEPAALRFGGPFDRRPHRCRIYKTN